MHARTSRPRSQIVALSLSCLLVALLAEPPLAAQPDGSTLVIHVEAAGKPGGNGSGSQPFRNLPEAVDSARPQINERSRIVIAIGPGTYVIPDTLDLDFPVSIHGANVPVTDSDKWPTGAVRGGTETRLVASNCDGPLLLVAGPESATVHDVEIRNLTFSGVAGGCGGMPPSIVAIRHAQNFTLADSAMLGPGWSGIDIAASSGVVTGNFVSGANACGICIGAGTDGSPALVTVTDNRSTGHAAGSLLINGTAYPLNEKGSSTEVTARHNDLSNNNANAALGFGVRVMAFGPNVPQDQVEGNITANFYDNRLADNQNAVLIDAGFPSRNISDTDCDEREFKASFKLTWQGNSIQGSTVRKALITFTRAQVLTGSSNPNNAPLKWQYLHNSTFVIDDPDLSLSGYELDHPKEDPVVGGACSKDATHEVLLNTLKYNGTEVPENH